MGFVEANGHIVQISQFRQAVISWGRNNFRLFPWRLGEEPYHLLIAEIMLHRTQAIQVVPVFEQFIQRFPDISALAQADDLELRSYLLPLGLHWRIPLLHTMAVKISQEFHGIIPKDKPTLLTLPGVSGYIASAVRCFAWNLPEGIVDTNTVRIIGRVFNLPTRDSSRRNRMFQNLLFDLVDPLEPKSYNYALLDIGALICTKSRPPSCQICPLETICAFGIQAKAVAIST